MAVPEKLTWRVVRGRRRRRDHQSPLRGLLTLGWKAATGKEPPQPGDSDASWAGAVTLGCGQRDRYRSGHRRAVRPTAGREGPHAPARLRQPDLHCSFGTS